MIIKILNFVCADSSDSSEDDEDPLPDRSQEAILAEAFSMDLNYGIVNVEGMAR